MERRPEDIFRVHDLSVLKSPMPAHLLAGRRTTPNPATHHTPPPPPVRPTPKQMSSPFGLSALTIHTPAKTSSKGAPAVVDAAPSAEAPSAEAPPGLAVNANTPGLGVSANARGSRADADAPRFRDDAPKPGPPSSSSSTLPTMEELLRKASAVSAASRQEAPAPEPTSQLSLVDDELKRQSEEELRTLTDLLKADIANRECESVATTVVEEETRMAVPETLVSADPVVAAPTAASVNGGPAKKSSAITLANWSLVVVPNNPMITRLDKSLVEDWIVLVGKRSDMTEMWHSSLVTGRLSNREITTGSGRLYVLDGALDDLALIEMGFSSETIDAFKDGFPENWQMLLIQELSEVRRESGSPDGPKDADEATTLRPRKDAEGAAAAAALRPKKDADELTTTPKPKRGVAMIKRDTLEPSTTTSATTKRDALLGPSATTKRDAPRPSGGARHASEAKENVAAATENAVTPTIKRGPGRPPKSARAATTTGKMTPTTTSRAAKGEPKSQPAKRRKSEPLSRWRDVHEITPSAQLPVQGRSRSGRALVAPLPYWENQYLRVGSSASPLAAAAKRRWGNHLGE